MVLSSCSLQWSLQFAVFFMLAVGPVPWSLELVVVLKWQRIWLDVFDRILTECLSLGGYLVGFSFQLWTVSTPVLQSHWGLVRPWEICHYTRTHRRLICETECQSVNWQTGIHNSSNWNIQVSFTTFHLWKSVLWLEGYLVGINFEEILAL